MNGRVAKKLRKEALKLTAAAPGYLGKKNRTVHRKDKDGKIEDIKILGTIFNRPGSTQAKNRQLKKAYTRGKGKA